MDDPAMEFLPPEPPGPEPDFGGRPARPAAPAQVEPRGWPPGQPGPPPGPPVESQTQPVAPQAPPGGPPAPPPAQPWQAPGAPYEAWGPPAAPGTPWAPPGSAGSPGPAYGLAAAPPEPDNGPAVAGFSLALAAAGLLVISFGLLALVSVPLAIFGIVLSQRGKRRFDAGETRKHRGLAQAGLITGIVTLALSAIVLVVEILLLVALATDEGFREDFEDGFEQAGAGPAAALRLAAAGCRLLL